MRQWTPMLASNGEEDLLDEEGFLFEPKLDGIRALCYLEDGALRLISRNAKNITAAYPELAFGGDLQAKQCVIDGEIVLYDQSGNPDFHALVRRHHRSLPPQGGRLVTFAAFDLLHSDGRDLLDVPLEDRKAALLTVLPERHERVESTVSTPQGRRLWEFMVARGQEGVVGKRLASRYEPGRRSSNWLKIKVFRTVDAVVVGYRSDRRPVSSLVLGLYDAGGQLHGVGRVGTGFSDATSKTLRVLLDEARRPTSPVVSLPDEPADVQWTDPVHVAEVRYLERGPNGALRHPSFLRLRPDKDPSECLLET